MKKKSIKKFLNVLVRHDNSQMRGIVLTGIMTGMAENEILGLRDEHIDFAGNKISAPGKDEDTQLPAQLSLVLKRLLKDHKSGYVFENSFTKTKFSSISRQWNEILQEAGLDHFGFNDLSGIHKSYLNIIHLNHKVHMDLLGYESGAGLEKWNKILEDLKVIDADE